MQESHPSSIVLASASAVASPEATSSAPAVATPLAARVAQALALLKMASDALAIETTPLSGLAVKRAVKFRKGGEQHVPTLASLSARYQLQVPSRPTAAMVQSLQEATDVEPVRVAIGELAKAVDDFYFSARSDSWTTATTLYGVLKKAGVREPNLQAAMAPMVEFFSYRHPSVAEDAKAKAAEDAKAKAEPTAKTE